MAESGKARIELNAALNYRDGIAYVYMDLSGSIAKEQYIFLSFPLFQYDQFIEAYQT